MTGIIPRPPFDPEQEAALSVINKTLPATITPEMIPAFRQPTPLESTAELLERFGTEQHDVRIPGHLGDEIILTIITTKNHTGTGPGFYHAHGGGMVIGDRFGGLAPYVEWAARYNGVVVSVEYRLAPEFPDPYPIEDCYAGLVWTAENSTELGIDVDRLVIGGESAGGGLAAGTALLARDRGGPKLAGQLLIYPMLDDRDNTVSAAQIDGCGIWDRESNRTGWSALLGDRRGGPEVSIYASPARATELSDLPPTFIDVGSAEVFRDEDVAYANAIWAAGGQAELHVWPGVFHGASALAPHTRLSQEMARARDAWIRRLLGENAEGAV
ncbi:alpha/beta hydrolase [Gordonia sp. NPDC003376]